MAAPPTRLTIGTSRQWSTCTYISMSGRPLSSLSLPRTTLSALTRAGYETTQDLSGTTAEEMSKDLNIPLQASHALFSASQKSMEPPLTQSAASMSLIARKFSTGCTPVDELLGGGLTRGSILEISGPPGTRKERIAVGTVGEFANAGEGVLFIDCQNMTTPGTLHKAILTSHLNLIHYLNIHALPELLIFMHNLSSYLESHSNIRLLVLNSISFPFQCANLIPSTRTALLERIKRYLAKSCVSRHLTVVTTTQLSTKLFNEDGSAGNFNTASRAVMVPQLGPAYLPSGRSYRLIIVPESRTSGIVKVMASPTYQPNQGAAPREAYKIVDGVMT